MSNNIERPINRIQLYVAQQEEKLEDTEATIETTVETAIETPIADEEESGVIDRMESSSASRN